MFLMIDNYDSFVYNLKAYFEELGREIMVRRSDQINIEEIEKGTALKKLSLKNYSDQKMVPVSPSLLPLPYLSIL